MSDWTEELVESQRYTMYAPVNFWWHEESETFFDNKDVADAWAEQYLPNGCTDWDDNVIPCIKQIEVVIGTNNAPVRWTCQVRLERGLFVFDDPLMDSYEGAVRRLNNQGGAYIQIRVLANDQAEALIQAKAYIRKWLEDFGPVNREENTLVKTPRSYTVETFDAQHSNVGRPEYPDAVFGNGQPQDQVSELSDTGRPEFAQPER